MSINDHLSQKGRSHAQDVDYLDENQLDLSSSLNSPHLIRIDDEMIAAPLQSSNHTIHTPLREPKLSTKPGLPPGWIECKDKRYQTYYVNTQTFESTWLHPTTHLAHASASYFRDDLDLPDFSIVYPEQLNSQYSAFVQSNFKNLYFPYYFNTTAQPMYSHSSQYNPLYYETRLNAYHKAVFTQEKIASLPKQLASAPKLQIQTNLYNAPLSWYQTIIGTVIRNPLLTILHIILWFLFICLVAAWFGYFRQIHENAHSSTPFQALSAMMPLQTPTPTPDPAPLLDFNLLLITVMLVYQFYLIAWVWSSCASLLLCGRYSAGILATQDSKLLETVRFFHQNKNSQRVIECEQGRPLNSSASQTSTSPHEDDDHGDEDNESLQMMSNTTDSSQYHHPIDIYDSDNHPHIAPPQTHPNPRNRSAPVDTLVDELQDYIEQKPRIWLEVECSHSSKWSVEMTREAQYQAKLTAFGKNPNSTPDDNLETLERLNNDLKTIDPQINPHHTITLPQFHLIRTRPFFSDKLVKVTTFRSTMEIPILHAADLSASPQSLVSAVNTTPAKYVNLHFHANFTTIPHQREYIFQLAKQLYYKHSFRDTNTSVSINYQVGNSTTTFPLPTASLQELQYNSAPLNSQSTHSDPLSNANDHTLLVSTQKPVHIHHKDHFGCLGNLITSFAFHPFFYFIWLHLLLYLPLIMFFRTVSRDLHYTNLKLLVLGNPLVECNQSNTKVLINSPRANWEWQWQRVEPQPKPVE